MPHASAPAIANSEVVFTIEQGGETYRLALSLASDRQARLTLKDQTGNLLGEAATDGAPLTQLLAKGPDGKSRFRQSALSGAFGAQERLSALAGGPNGATLGGGQQGDSLPFSLTHPSPALAVLGFGGVLPEEAQMLFLGYDPVELSRNRGGSFARASRRSLRSAASRSRSRRSSSATTRSLPASPNPSTSPPRAR